MSAQQPTKFRTTGWILVDTAFKCRVQSPPGTDITQSSISAISYTVKEMVGANQGTQTGTGTPAVGSSVFNTPQTPMIDPSWVVDNYGYNFSVTIPGAAFPDVGDYVVTFLLTPSGGGSTFPIVFFHHCNSVS
jgi:hypothetical protein